MNNESRIILFESFDCIRITNIIHEYESRIIIQETESRIIIHK